MKNENKALIKLLFLKLFTVASEELQVEGYVIHADWEGTATLHAVTLRTTQGCAGAAV